ncbi:hypothetical protein B7494_g2930 [Chlorociboria aeruginascens]|nr:hypothetical protein B7494_g2930 [Chlorociboria aeruginascens]
MAANDYYNSFSRPQQSQSPPYQSYNARSPAATSQSYFAQGTGPSQSQTRPSASPVSPFEAPFDDHVYPAGGYSQSQQSLGQESRYYGQGGGGRPDDSPGGFRDDIPLRDHPQVPHKDSDIDHVYDAPDVGMAPHSMEDGNKRTRIETGSPIEIKPSFNPMIGPSPWILINMGARYVPCMHNVKGIQDANATISWGCPNTTSTAGETCTLSQLCGFGGKVPNPLYDGDIHQSPEPNQWYRFIIPMFLHAGIIHIGFNMLLQMTLGKEMELIIGPIRFFLVYIASGIFGFVLGGNYAASGIASTGASGSLFGIIALNLLDLFYTWKTRRNPGKELAFIMLDIVISFVLGLLPGLDNFSHIGGFLMGLILGICILHSPDSLRKRINQDEPPYTPNINGWCNIGNIQTTSTNITKRAVFDSWGGMAKLCALHQIARPREVAALFKKHIGILESHIKMMDRVMMSMRNEMAGFEAEKKLEWELGERGNWRIVCGMMDRAREILCQSKEIGGGILPPSHLRDKSGIGVTGTAFIPLTPQLDARVAAIAAGKPDPGMISINKDPRNVLGANAKAKTTPIGEANKNGNSGEGDGSSESEDEEMLDGPDWTPLNIAKEGETKAAEPVEPNPYFVVDTEPTPTVAHGQDTSSKNSKKRSKPADAESDIEVEVEIEEKKAKKKESKKEKKSKKSKTAETVDFTAMEAKLQAEVEAGLKAQKERSQSVETGGKESNKEKKRKRESVGDGGKKVKKLKEERTEKEKKRKADTNTDADVDAGDVENADRAGKKKKRHRDE